MAISFLRYSETQPQQPLACLRGQAALVRTLLDELDRLIVPGGASRDEGAAAGQLAEELARLTCRMLECAAAMTSAHTSSDERRPELFYGVGQ